MVAHHLTCCALILFADGCVRCVFLVSIGLTERPWTSQFGVRRCGTFSRWRQACLYGVDGCCALSSRACLPSRGPYHCSRAPSPRCDARMPVHPHRSPSR